MTGSLDPDTVIDDFLNDCESVWKSSLPPDWYVGYWEEKTASARAAFEEERWGHVALEAFKLVEYLMRATLGKSNGVKEVPRTLVRDLKKELPKHGLLSVALLLQLEKSSKIRNRAAHGHPIDDAVNKNDLVTLVQETRLLITDLMTTIKARAW